MKIFRFLDSMNGRMMKRTYHALRPRDVGRVTNKETGTSVVQINLRNIQEGQPANDCLTRESLVLSKRMIVLGLSQGRN